MTIFGMQPWLFSLARPPAFSTAGPLPFGRFQLLLRLLFQFTLGLSEPLQSALRASQFRRQSISRWLLSFYGVHLTCTPKHFIHLLFPVPLLFTQFFVAHRLMLARVGFHFRAVDRHLPQFHQSCLLAQLERLQK